MVMFRGPVVFGYSENDLSLHNEISAMGQPTRASWMVTAYSYFFGVIFLVSTAFVMNNESTDWSLTKSEFWAVLYAVSIISILILLRELNFRIVFDIKLT